MATEASIQMIYCLILSVIQAVVIGFELGVYWADRDVRKLDNEIEKLEAEARKIQRFYVEDTQTVKRLG